jgi:hypothetical protein
LHFRLVVLEVDAFGEAAGLVKVDGFQDFLFARTDPALLEVMDSGLVSFC